MADARSGIWMFMLVMYFLGLTIFVNAVDNASNELGTEINLSETGGFSDNSDPFNSLESCQTPRYFTNPNNGEYIEIPFYNKHSSDCKYTQGSVDPNTCSDIVGCTWENESTFFWLFTTDAHCSGLVNMTEYTSVNVSVVDLSGTIEVDETGKSAFCSLMENENSCNVMGCTWTDRGDSLQNLNLKSLATTISELFTYQVDIGLSSGMNFIFVTFFFWLPFILLLIAFYFALPFT